MTKEGNTSDSRSDVISEVDERLGVTPGIGTPTEASPRKNKRKWPFAVGIVAIVLVVAGAGFWVWHEQPSFCGTVCHNTMNSYVETWEGGNYTVRAHAEQDISCLGCHETTLSEQITEATKQITGDYSLPFAKMETDDSFCLRDGCHVRAEIEQATADMSVDGVPVNPHTQSMNKGNPDNPHEGQGDAIACAECHTMHRKSKEMDYCYSCHHAETFADCYSCHDHK